MCSKSTTVPGMRTANAAPTLANSFAREHVNTSVTISASICLCFTCSFYSFCSFYTYSLLLVIFPYWACESFVGPANLCQADEI